MSSFSSSSNPQGIIWVDGACGLLTIAEHLLIGVHVAAFVKLLIPGRRGIDGIKVALQDLSAMVGWLIVVGAGGASSYSYS